MAKQVVPYHAPWDTIPICVIDFETTGTQPGLDKAVEVGLARFEGGRCVAELGSRINPGIPIPPGATEIHHISDADVANAPTIIEYMHRVEVQQLLSGAQPAAYNAPFDRWFCPPSSLEDWTWPWLDAMVLVVEVDKFAKGSGRYRLETACARHGVTLTQAHSAKADARATGELFHVLVGKRFLKDRISIGELLAWTRGAEAERWADFHSWLGRQPAKAAAP